MAVKWIYVLRNKGGLAMRGSNQDDGEMRSLLESTSPERILLHVEGVIFVRQYGKHYVQVFIREDLVYR